MKKHHRFDLVLILKECNYCGIKQLNLDFQFIIDLRKISLLRFDLDIKRTHFFLVSNKSSQSYSS